MLYTKMLEEIELRSQWLCTTWNKQATMTPGGLKWDQGGYVKTTPDLLQTHWVEAPLRKASLEEALEELAKGRFAGVKTPESPNLWEVQDTIHGLVYKNNSTSVQLHVGMEFFIKGTSGEEPLEVEGAPF